jgi:hypothetical protein
MIMTVEEILLAKPKLCFHNDGDEQVGDGSEDGNTLLLINISR